MSPVKLEDVGGVGLLSTLAFVGPVPRSKVNSDVCARSAPPLASGPPSFRAIFDRALTADVFGRRGGLVLVQSRGRRRLGAVGQGRASQGKVCPCPLPARIPVSVNTVR